MDSMNEAKTDVIVAIVPFPAQGHLNQLMQLSCLISSYGIPVHYIGSAIHNQQARVRINGLNSQDVSKIQFHDLPNPSFESPSPNPNSLNKFPSQLMPAWDATLTLRQPVFTSLLDMSSKVNRLVVIHDPFMAYVLQDVSSIPNAESYVFNCFPAFCKAYFACEKAGIPFPIQLPKDFPSLDKLFTGEVLYFVAMQFEHVNNRAGDIDNTCRLLEGPYLDLIHTGEEKIDGKKRKNWALGPIIPRNMPSSLKNECLEWLDKQEAKSVIFVTFGTTTSLSDEQIEELALGLEKSKQKFLWVLRDADRGNVFDGQIRIPKLPLNFEERMGGVGIVVRDWAPQPEILAHPSTGGFMSHCGWNSCMESIAMGVPVAAWPMHSDQPINSVLITEVLKTGILVRENWTQMEEVVKASTVEKAIRKLMASEEGNEIRKRAEELACTLRQAIEEGGVSRLELDSFVAHITRDDTGICTAKVT